MKSLMYKDAHFDGTMVIVIPPAGSLRIQAMTLALERAIRMERLKERSVYLYEASELSAVGAALSAVHAAPKDRDLMREGDVCAIAGQEGPITFVPSGREATDALMDKLGDVFEGAAKMAGVNEPREDPAPRPLINGYFYDWSDVGFRSSSGVDILDVQSIKYNAATSAVEVRSLRPGGKPPQLVSMIGKSPLTILFGEWTPAGGDGRIYEQWAIHFENCTMGFPCEMECGHVAIEVAVLSGVRVECVVQSGGR